VSAIVFWPVNNEPQTSTSFLLICLAVIDNIMLSLYYVLLGIPHTCIFYDSCKYYMKVNRPNCVDDAMTVKLSPIASSLRNVYASEDNQYKCTKQRL